MDNAVLTHDAGVSAFADAGGVVSTDDDSISFNWDENHVVTVDAPADLEGAFNTDRFYKIEGATIARPIKQRYVVGDSVETYVKPADELRRAAWSFDNTPFTIPHPDSGMVKNVDDIDGFWRNPRYDDDAEALREDLYIPVTNDEALSFIEEHQDVSVGFYNRVHDSYDGDVGGLVDDDADVDGYQVEMYGNHVAGVKRGRCSAEDGCGLDRTPKGSVYSKAADSRAMPFGVDEEDMDLSVPEDAQSAAQNFLDAVEEGKVPDSCGGPDGTGRRRAGMFAEGGDLSLETWVTGGTDAVANWHPRHEGNEDYDESEVETPWEDCGYAMFKAWGGAAARDKAARLKEQYKASQDSMFNIDASEGEWVEWDASGGTAYGKVDNIVRDGCTTRGKGSQKVCAEDDNPAVEVEVYDDESGESKDEIVRHKESELRSWSGPTNDASTSFMSQENMTEGIDPPEWDTGDVVEWQANSNMYGEIVATDESRKIVMVELMEDGEESGYTLTAGYTDIRMRNGGSTTDAPSGLYAEDGKWYGIAPSETADDEPKYELDNCNDVKDAWNLRGSGDYDVEQSTLEARIKRAADSHGCPPEQKPWTTSNMDDEFDIPDLSVDAIAEKNESVSALKAERDSLESTVDEMESEIRTALDSAENVTIEVDEDECVCEAVEDIVSDFDDAVERVEHLEDELEEYRAEEREEALDELTDLGADEEEWSDESLDALEDEIERRKEVLDAAGETTVKNVDSSTGSTDEQSETTLGGTRKFGRGHSA